MSPQLDRLSAPRTRKGSRRRRLGVRLTNPLREICTVGSVREESPKRHDGPKRARSWKRRRQPRKVYSASGLLYSAAFHIWDAEWGYITTKISGHPPLAAQ